MSSVLTVEQREQAGSDSYNRFEYQVHWIDVNDVKYQEIVVVLRKTISTYCESCETRYKKFYKENLALGKAIINEVSVVTENIQEYLEKRNLELINEDDNGIISEEEEFWI